MIQVITIKSEIEMKTLKRKYSLFVFVLFILVFLGVHQTIAAQVEVDTLYYGIEINGVLCGYSEINTSSVVKDGKDMILLKEKVFVMLSALGSEFNQEVQLTQLIISS